jgi:hypothetical protein
MTKGMTYPRIRSMETPPEMMTVDTRIINAANSVARIDSKTVLWSSAKVSHHLIVTLKALGAPLRLRLFCEFATFDAVLTEL